MLRRGKGAEDAEELPGHIPTPLLNEIWEQKGGDGRRGILVRPLSSPPGARLVARAVAEVATAPAAAAGLAASSAARAG